MHPVIKIFLFSLIFIIHPLIVLSDDTCPGWTASDENCHEGCYYNDSSYDGDGNKIPTDCYKCPGDSVFYSTVSSDPTNQKATSCFITCPEPHEIKLTFANNSQKTIVTLGSLNSTDDGHWSTEDGYYKCIYDHATCPNGQEPDQGKCSLQCNDALNAPVSGATINGNILFNVSSQTNQYNAYDIQNNNQTIDYSNCTATKTVSTPQSGYNNGTQIIKTTEYTYDTTSGWGNGTDTYKIKCAAGYYFNGTAADVNSNSMCEQVGKGYYSEAGCNSRCACPNITTTANGTTTAASPSDCKLENVKFIDNRGTITNLTSAGTTQITATACCPANSGGQSTNGA